MFTTWASETLSAEVLSLLNVLSLLDPDRIDESIFQVKEQSLPDPNRDDESIRPVDDRSHTRILRFPTTRSFYITAWTALPRNSLINRNSDGVSLVIHILVQDVTHARLLPADYLHVFELAHTLSIRSLPGQEHFSDDTSTWEVSDRVVPYALKLFALLSEQEELGLKCCEKISTFTPDSGDC